MYKRQGVPPFRGSFRESFPGPLQSVWFRPAAAPYSRRAACGGAFGRAVTFPPGVRRGAGRKTGRPRRPRAKAWPSRERPPGVVFRPRPSVQLVANSGRIRASPVYHIFRQGKTGGRRKCKKAPPGERGEVFGIFCDGKPPFKQICLNGGLEQITGIYPRPEKQPTGLFFARCGVPACSIPRYACQRKRPPRPDAKNVTAHPRKQKRRAPLRTGSSVTLVEQVTGIEPALSAWEAEVLPLHHTCAVDL